MSEFSCGRPDCAESAPMRLANREADPTCPHCLDAFVAGAAPVGAYFCGSAKCAERVQTLLANREAHPPCLPCFNALVKIITRREGRTA